MQADDSLTRLVREHYESGRHGDAHLILSAETCTALPRSAPPSPFALPPSPFALLLGIPIVVDDRLQPGEWRLVGNAEGEVRECGHLAGEEDNAREQQSGYREE